MRFFGSKGIRFSDTTTKCCIGFIDLVNSTKNTLMFYNSQETRKYYTTFINSIYEIVKKNQGKIIKNIGDSVLFYFPKTCDNPSMASLSEVLDCGFEILNNRQKVNNELAKQNFPPFNYRLSLDHGTVEIALSGEYNQLDLFGSTVNLCAKINSISRHNKLIVGQNLFRRLNAYSNYFEKKYTFTKSASYEISLDNAYSTYIIEKRLSNVPVIKTSEDLDQNVSHYSNGLVTTKSPYIINEEEYNRETECRHYDITKKIVIIDDDPDVLSNLKLFLKDSKYHVTLFTEAGQALEYFQSNPFYNNLLVIADIRMKQLNGFQLYLHIKCMDPTIKFLFITAYDIIDEVSALIPGFDKSNILKKPIDQRAFLNKVKHMLPS